ncbi:hypothetical protein U9M48_001613 [Paspalum notatum var. saurae]|uniref:Polygalacturonase n=1 Tax=Paspalum notatum var. saurae TaxID=547442 RepID=A0AAQ3PG23_PASNO
MEYFTARTAITLLLLLAVSSSFLYGGVNGGSHLHHHGKHNSAHPPSSSAHTPGPASGRRQHAQPPNAWPVSPLAPPPSRRLPDAWHRGAGASNVYDVVKDCRAVGDGVTDDTDAIKSAWYCACGDDGDSVVLAAAGYTFLVHATVFTGPCNGSVTIQLDGTIVAPSDPNKWTEVTVSKLTWLLFYRADGMSLQGAGLIDGKGQKWWALPCKSNRGHGGSSGHGAACVSPVGCRQPMKVLLLSMYYSDGLTLISHQALRFFMTSNVTVRGLKVQNSPEFHIRFDSSPAQSPNTDGIHVENTTDVLITNTVVSIGAGTLNMHVENVTCGPGGHGISIGSLGKNGARACVANVTVRNALIKHSDNGVRIKTWRQGGSGAGAGAVSTVSFQNVSMEAVRNPIIIDQYYCLSKSCKNSTSAVFINDISYTGIWGTYDAHTPPIHFGCSDACAVHQHHALRRRAASRVKPHHPRPLLLEGVR